jgi:hypothetical protein
MATFRNLGNRKFEDAGPAWGFEQPALHNGIALADLDNDGGLDVVINNLGCVASVYHNHGSAPRVAVRLKGLPPNTQGIGAKIKLLGGAVPMQSQEVACGGLYQNVRGKPGLRVRLAGPPGNPDGVGATMRLVFGGRMGAAREISVDTEGRTTVKH